MLGFLVIVHLLWLVLHAFVAFRVVRPLTSRWLRWFLYVVLAVMSVVSPLVFHVDHWVTPELRGFVRWYLWIYIGAFSTFFALTVARDLLLLAFRGVDKLRARRGSPQLMPSSPERRAFLLNTTSGAIGGATFAVSAYGAREARRTPEIVEVEVPIAGLPEELDGYHIVQLSDMHVGETIDKDFILPIVEAASALGADLIALTGDMVDGSVDKLRVDVSPLAYLRARDGVLLVTGNHETYSGVAEWCSHFKSLGITVLNNEHLLVQRGAASMLVAGVTDLRETPESGGFVSDPQRALTGAPAHDVRILLAHQPRSALTAHKHGFALQLSGHTHGGQFFPWNLLVGLVQPVSKGLAKVGQMWVYVNRGTCYWGPPLRSFVPAEITSLRLKRA